MKKITTATAALALSLVAAMVSSPASAEKILCERVPLNTEIAQAIADGEGGTFDGAICQYECMDGNILFKLVPHGKVCRDAITKTIKDKE